MKKIIITSVLSFIVSYANCQFNNTFPFAPGEKKIIEFGWDMPTARWMAKNTAAMDQSPFDGVIFSPAGHLDVLYAWEQANWETTGRIDTTNLLAITWAGKANSFINIWSGQDGINLSYFDDNLWVPVLANMRYVARLAKKAGIAGISFDTEAYSTIKPFDRQAHLEGHTEAELDAKVRQRGAQIMEVWQSEYPTIKVLGMFFMSFDIPTWELIPVFADGMLSATTTAKMIEGQELSYYYTTTNQYFNSYNEVKTKFRDQYCSPSNYTKHATNFQVSKAVYMDYVLSKYSSDEQKRRWEHNIYNGLVAADEYCWIYTEGFSYWNNPQDHGLPAGALTYPPWSGAVEGIRSAKSKYNAQKRLGWDMVNGSVNTSVQVSLTTSATVVEDSGSVTLTAQTSGVTISKIDLYQNMQIIQSKTTAPYVFTVSDIPTGNYEFIAHAYSSNATGTSNPLNVSVYDFDSIPPIAPTGLVASNIGLTSFTLSWTAASDSGGVATYEVLNDGDYVGTTTSTSIEVKDLACSTTYQLTVKARYGSSNWSAESVPLPVITSDCVPCTLPEGWTGIDIGTTKQTVCEDDGVFKFDGVGLDYKNDAFSFRYAYKTLSGDGVITAKVESNENTTAWARSGIMIRESLASGSKHVDCFATTGNGISFQVKSGSGKTTSTLASGISMPCWVRLERIDSTFNAYYSVDGTSWSQVGSKTTVAMAQDVYIGLAVTSQGACATCASDISNVSTIGKPTLIAQTDLIKDISFSPNPAKSIFTLSNLPLNANISVFAVDGRMIESAKATTIKMEFDVSRWNKGIYLFRVQTEDGVVIKKMIKE